MKAIIISALVSLALVEVYGGSTYGEREDVKRVVNAKYTEVKNYTVAVDALLDIEGKRLDIEACQDALTQGKYRKDTTAEQLKNASVAYTKIAIAKGKPLAAIECIVKTVEYGGKLIAETSEKHIRSVITVQSDNAFKVVRLRYDLNLIKPGLEDIKKEFDKKINAAKFGFKALKADALRKFSTARKQLDGIMKLAPKPTLAEGYAKTKRIMEANYAKVKQTFTKRFQRCVAY